MNVVFIQADQHARQFMGCYGNTARTPSIDSIARAGVRFDNAYCCSPICSPTRASLFTGRYVHETGVWDNTGAYAGTPRGWPHHLQDSGIAFTSIGRLDFKAGCDLGLNDYRFASLRDSPDVVALFREQPTVQRRAMHYEYYTIKPRDPGVSLLEADGEPTEKNVTDEAVKWLKHERPAERPWVLYVGYCTPHPKWKPDAALLDACLKDVPPLAEKYLQPIEDLHPFDRRGAVSSCAYTNRDDTQLTLMHAAYLAVCHEFDREIGRILDTLEDQGIRDDTLIIYASDHGESARAHGNLGKCSMYEESVGIPLLMSGPGLQRGGAVGGVVSQLDLFPTIAEAVGLPQPAFSRGRSLLPQATGAAPDPPDARVLSEYHAANAPGGVFTIRTGDWKFIEHLGEEPSLFNLREDPDEMHDLVRHEPNAGGTRNQVERMRAILHDICDPAQIDRTAKEDQRRLRAELAAAGRLEEEVYQRGYQRSAEELIPWEWKQFDELYGT